MGYFSIAFKNLFRRKGRTLLTIGGVAVAVSVFVSLMGFQAGYREALNNDIDKMGYQVLVTAKGCPYEAATLMLKGGAGLRYMEEEVYRDILEDPRVAQVTPQLIQVAYDVGMNDGRGGYIFIMGIDESIHELKPWMSFRAGGWFSGEDVMEVILGYEAAELEQRSPGDRFFLPGVEGDFKVVGVYERTGTHDDGTVFVPLKTLQSIFHLSNKLTGVGIKLKDVGLIPEFEEALYNVPGIQVISMAQVKGTITGLVASAQVLIMAVASITIVVAVMGVMNTILMSVFERTQEIGVMRAVGASRMGIFRILWNETIIICAMGGVIGNIVAILGGAGVEFLVRKTLPYAPKGELILVTPELMVLSIVGATLLGLVSGIYPAYRASKVSPKEAIRNE